MILMIWACSQDTADATSLLHPPTWEETDIQEAFDEVIAYGFPDPNDFWVLYKELYDEGATSSCPGTEYNFDGQELTAYDCYTPDGFQFEGLSEFMYELGGWRLHLEGRIRAPDGRIVHGAGSVAIEEMDGIRKTFEGTLYSNFGAEWLKHTPSLLLYLEQFNGKVVLDGGYTIGGKSISFDRFQVDDCPNGNGNILLREPQGGWWTYTARCSDTGTLWYHHEEVASLTLDITNLVQEIQRILP